VIRSWCKRLGVLGMLSAAALLVGLLIQRVAHLPLSYDWAFPYHVLWFDVLAASGCPSAILAVALLGWISVRGERSVAECLALPSPRTERPIAVLALFCAVVTACLDAWLFKRHAPWDWVASGVLCALWGLQARRESTPLWRSLGSTLYGVAGFAAVFFFYTVVKSTLFLHAKPLDTNIIAFEIALIHAPPYWAVAAWSATRPHFVAFCDWTYFRLFHHMLLTLVLLAARRGTSERIEYLGALFICYLLGAPLYHLCPAWGPGFYDSDRFAYLNDPALTTAGVRYWIWQNTQQIKDHTATELFPWSYVACMPSLHVAHEIVMTFYARRPLPALIVSFAFTIATLVAVVVLGWHYAIDWFAGGLLGAVAIFSARRLRGSLWPAILVPASDP
jgi:hypothetical protein